jgi:hypothetical protein
MLAYPYHGGPGLDREAEQRLGGRRLLYVMEKRAHARPPPRILHDGEILAFLKQFRRSPGPERSKANAQAVQVKRIQTDREQTTHLMKTREQKAHVIEPLTQPC